MRKTIIGAVAGLVAITGIMGAEATEAPVGTVSNCDHAGSIGTYRWAADCTLEGSGTLTVNAKYWHGAVNGDSLIYHGDGWFTNRR